MRRRDDQAESGAIIVLYALMLVVIFLFAALAIDLGNLSQNHQVAQDATDSAAIAGAGYLGTSAFTSGTLTEAQVVTDVENEVIENSSNYPGLTAGSTLWDTCSQSLPPGWPTWPNDASGNPQDCIGFNSGSTSADIIQVAIPPQVIKYWFGKVGGVTGQAISALSTAEVSSGGGSGQCAVCLLGTSGEDLTITSSGGTVLAVSATSGTANVIDDSSAEVTGSQGPNGVTATGQVELATGPSGAGCTITGSGTGGPGNGCYSPQPSAGSVTDPLAGLGTPAQSEIGSGTGTGVTSDNGVVSQTCTGSCTLTLTPGIYSSVSITQAGTDTVTLDSGTYVFTGAFSITGGGATTITNSSGGVLLYFTCGSGTNPSPCSSGGESGGSLDLTGTGTTALDLSSMTTGPFAGLTVYYDRNDTAALYLTASGGSTFEGSIYAKSSAVRISVSGSTATLESMIDVESMTVTSTGIAGLDVVYNPSQNVPLESDIPELCSMTANNC